MMLGLLIISLGILTKCLLTTPAKIHAMFTMNLEKEKRAYYSLGTPMLFQVALRILGTILLSLQANPLIARGIVDMKGAMGV